MKTNKRLYDLLVEEVRLRYKMENDLEEIGFHVEYGEGIFGTFLQASINQIDMMFQNCFGLHQKIAKVKSDFFRCEVPVDVLYPEDNNKLYCVTLDDFSNFLCNAHNKELTDAMWNAIVERDPQAIAYIADHVNIQLGYAPVAYDVTQQSDYDKYLITIDAIKQHYATEQKLKSIGFDYFNFPGSFTDYMAKNERNLKESLMYIMNLYERVENVTCQEYHNPIKLYLIYPMDNDDNFSLTTDEFEHFLDQLNDDILVNQMWKALAEKDSEAKKYINSNYHNIHVGPVEEENG